ncbi:hypothetical protein B0T17DRAFT_223332 [Bombardia bombarda]|uniref:Uncharacterized protein n=1 Tax=Bombardia bombarda TaxID=252184 RepID=A0AA40C9L6_9PEZI|nr:hypothetical protein B0T17DRAFT_223332 [Bombardia bombarda]
MCDLNSRSLLSFSYNFLPNLHTTSELSFLMSMHMTGTLPAKKKRKDGKTERFHLNLTPTSTSHPYEISSNHTSNQTN